MKDESKAKLRPLVVDSQVTPSEGTPVESVKSIDDFMAALRKSMAKRAQMSDEQRQAELSQTQRLALQGNREAQKELGSIYYLGEGVAQDYAESAKWLRHISSSSSPLCNSPALLQTIRKPGSQSSATIADLRR